jgi:hypothetical protein
MDIIPMSESRFPNEYFKNLSLKGLDRNYHFLRTNIKQVNFRVFSKGWISNQKNEPEIERKKQWSL